MKVPFSPPHISEDAIQEVVQVLRSGWITTGPRTKEFEKRLANYLNVERVIALNSWTNACELALRWFGIEPGDEVIIPSYTYCATANIVEHLGAKPVMVDIKNDFTMDFDQVAAHINERTKCIMPVDIGGLPSDIHAALNLAEAHRNSFKPKGEVQKRIGRVLVMLDAAHSFGARYGTEMLGGQADISGFSFHAVKNLTTAEGGALAFNLPEGFNIDEVYKWFNTMSLHGQSKDALAKSSAGGWRYDVIAPGFKCNMTDLQAALGLVALDEYEPLILPKRKEVFNAYLEGFSASERFSLPKAFNEQGESSYHLFMLRIKGFSEEQRDKLIAFCAKREVAVNVHFQPLPMLAAYKERGYRMADYPKALEMYSNELSLPIFHGITAEQIALVVQTVTEGVAEITQE